MGFSLLFFSLGAAAFLILTVTGGSAGTMTNSWAVRVQSGGDTAADALASKYGFTNLGLVGNLDDVYHFIAKEQASVSASVKDFPAARYVTRLLQAEPSVIFAEQQERRFFDMNGYSVPNDRLWSQQWYLTNTGGWYADHHSYVERAWLQGVTGCGVTVAVVDSGVENTHTDLINVYDKNLQYDFLDNSNDAFPRDTYNGRESHGTKCAGVIAMEKGNGKCGVGVAYNAFITGLRLVSTLKGATNIDQANALSWQNRAIDIYSNSWGPVNNGKVVHRIGVTAMSLEDGAKKGRGGKGSIYVFAAGNGGDISDTCAADGLVNSIYTIAVGSVSISGRQSYYDEQCSGKLVVAFTDNPNQPNRAVVGADVYKSCTSSFIGTSASTPQVSGAIALLLEVNPNLTWRDVQYLLAYTSNKDKLVDGEWTTNGRGLRVSHKFGFGVLDAEALVTRGRHWTNVPPQFTKIITLSSGSARGTLHGQMEKVIKFTAQSDILYLEHIIVYFTMAFTRYSSRSQHNNRGKFEVLLTSPSGTISTLLPLRPPDSNSYANTFDNWPLMSVHFWGENPNGKWTVTVRNNNPRSTLHPSRVAIPQVAFYGTSTVPLAVSRIPSSCSSECDPNRGCAAMGAQYCDACAKLRLASTLACVSSCPRGTRERSGYCYAASDGEKKCTKKFPKRTPVRLNSALAKMMQV